MNAVLRAIATRTAVAVAMAGTLMGTTAFAADDVNVRFSWKLKGEYAHMYLAEQEGYFEENDLNVSMGEGAGSQAALGALLQGQEDVVIMPGAFALTAIQQGMPIKIIALYHPVVPVVLISHPENPIEEPADLEGKTIAHAVGETGTSYLGVVCEANDVDCDKVDLVTMSSQARVPAFLQKQVDAVSVYRSNDLPIIEQDVGQQFPVFSLGDHGLTVPGMAAVSSDAIIAEKPDVLRRFLSAVDQAIEHTKDDPKAAAEAIKAVWPEGPSIEAIQAQVEATMEAIPASEDKPYGWIEEEDIEASLEVLATEEEFEGEPRPADTYYTNELFAAE